MLALSKSKQEPPRQVKLNMNGYRGKYGVKSNCFPLLSYSFGFSKFLSDVARN